MRFSFPRGRTIPANKKGVYMYRKKNMQLVLFLLDTDFRSVYCVFTM
jgi:hypothetical protein